jgi:FtsZ-binding cell division protein ZapB
MTMVALPAQQEGAAQLVDATRSAIEKWVEARSVLGKEKRDWMIGRDLVQARLQLVQREIEGVRGRIAEAQKSTTEADQKREELVAENQKLTDAAKGLQDAILTLEERTRKLLARLPEPLREKVKSVSQRLPEAGAATKLALSERYLTVVGVLNEINKFQREVTVTSEVRALGDGTTAEVTAIYLGISQGYYATNNGKAAGVGTATATGWEWTPANQEAPRILQMIAILKSEQPAAFVPVPVKVQ